jgi:hypothetical protein
MSNYLEVVTGRILALIVRYTCVRSSHSGPEYRLDEVIAGFGSA